MRSTALFLPFIFSSSPLPNSTIQTHAMKQYRIAALALLALVFACFSCQEDDILPNKKNNTELSANTNANSTTVNTNYGRLEFPHLKTTGNNLVLVHTVDKYGVNFAVEWDCDKKAQRWTCYQMNATNSGSNWKRDNWKNTEWGGDPFQEDTIIPKPYRTTLADYRGSGYDRGHICPSADRLNSKEANEQTYYLSNIQPQINGFNTGIWLTMENTLRTKWNTSTYRDVLYVCKGGTIDSKSNISGYTNSGLIVPKYYYVAVLAVKNGKYHALGLWFEHKANSDTNLRTYAVTIDRLEQLTGLDFFCNLPDATEEEVEASIDLSWWGL